MDEYRYAACPYCSCHSDGRYRIDITPINRAYVSCPECRKKYIVLHGEHQIKSIK